jgi:hypothetical protein
MPARPFHAAAETAVASSGQSKTQRKITMAEHEPSIGATSDWRSPPEYFGPKAIDLVFDMDVASPGLDKCFVPAKACFTIEEDGLKQLWRPSWLIFMNPPFGGRNGHVPWLVKFLDHANGIAIVRAYPQQHQQDWSWRRCARQRRLCLFAAEQKCHRGRISLGAELSQPSSTGTCVVDRARQGGEGQGLGEGSARAGVQGGCLRTAGSAQ